METQYRKPNKMKAAIIGGSIMVATSMIPYLSYINCLCCAGIMLGGFAAVYFYRRDLPFGEQTLEAKHGVLLGAFAGIFGSVFETVISLVMIKMLSEAYFDQLNNEFEDAFNKFYGGGGQELISQVRNIVNGILYDIKNYGFSPLFSVITLTVNTFKDILFGLLGGLIAIYTLQRKRKENLSE